MVTSSTIGTYKSLTIEYSKLCAVIIDAMILITTITIAQIWLRVTDCSLQVRARGEWHRFLSRYLMLSFIMMMFKIMMMMTLIRMGIKSVTGPLFIQILEDLDENSDDDN